MKTEVAKRLAELADSMGFEFSFREDYSGRGMYGRTTAGITVTSLQDFAKFLYEAAEYIHQDQQEGFLPERIGSFSVDNMGYDYILY